MKSGTLLMIATLLLILACPGAFTTPQGEWFFSGIAFGFSIVAVK